VAVGFRLDLKVGEDAQTLWSDLQQAMQFWWCGSAMHQGKYVIDKRTHAPPLKITNSGSAKSSSSAGVWWVDGWTDGLVGGWMDGDGAKTISCVGSPLSGPYALQHTCDSKHPLPLAPPHPAPAMQPKRTGLMSMLDMKRAW